MNPYMLGIEIAWQSPKHVFYDAEALERIARDLATQELKLTDWKAPVFPEGNDDTFISFIVVANSINFCFTDFATHNKFDVEYPEGSGTTWEGAFAMFAALKRAHEEGKSILDPCYLSRLTRKRGEHIFRCVTTPIPMLYERVENLKNLGQTLKRQGIKNPAELFEDSDFYAYRDDGNGIIQKMLTFSCYRDISIWKGYSLDFIKRAQLLPMMYHGRAVSSGGALQPLRDPENIGPIADYQVPRALRSLGILIYGSDLAEKVDNRKIIGKDTEMEIEIRAQTVRAMSALLVRVNELRSPEKQIIMAELDFEIWKMGRKSEGFHHYTYTTAY